MDELRINQLTKELVAAELKQLGDPCEKAAHVIKRTLKAAFSRGPNPQIQPGRVIEDAVKGTMTALLLADQGLARGAIMVLEAVLDVAAECQLDPTDSMRSALIGLADMRRFLDPTRIDEIRRMIDAEYMGAGDVFNELLREATSTSATPAPPQPE